MMEMLYTRGPYMLFVVLMMIGTYILLAHRNLLKALIGLYVFQTGIILFFIMVAYRRGGTLPILPDNGAHSEPPPLINPLPHALMLTAIVVGVATLGVGLSILRRIQREAGTIEDRVTEED